jgi:parallel beta-helix repeat protein
MCGWAQDPVCVGACTGAGQPYACCTGAGAGSCCDPGDAGNFLIESNLFYNNEGNCMSIFKSSGATVRNNTCWKNQRRPSGGEITAFTNRSSFFNNILVPRSERTCWQSTNQGADCTSNASVCQGGTCLDKWALALYGQSSIFPIVPQTNSEGSNIMWSPSTQNVVQFGYGQAGTVAQFISFGQQYGYGAGDLQQNPLLVNPDATPPDFRLQASSPAAGSANQTHLAPADITGASRTTADRGAYARGTGAPPTTTPTTSPPTTTGATVSTTRDASDALPPTGAPATPRPDVEPQ